MRFKLPLLGVLVLAGLACACTSAPANTSLVASVASPGAAVADVAGVAVIDDAEFDPHHHVWVPHVVRPAAR
jgi:hypothetical protein